jgi:hypothetical protein
MMSTFYWMLYKLTGMPVFRYQAYYRRIHEVRHTHTHRKEGLDYAHLPGGGTAWAPNLRHKEGM